MRLTPHEQERLLLSYAAELARRRQSRGLRLNLPEATAVITDHVLEGARDGVRVAELPQTGRDVLSRAGGHHVTALACRPRGLCSATRIWSRLPQTWWTLTASPARWLVPRLHQQSGSVRPGEQPSSTPKASRTSSARWVPTGISRVAVISPAPVGPRIEQPFLERRVLMPVLERVFGSTYDVRRMEQILRASDVDWVSLRPPRLVSKPATGRYRVEANGPPRKARSISFPDLATALLDSLDREHLYRRAAFIAN